MCRENDRSLMLGDARTDKFSLMMVADDLRAGLVLNRGHDGAVQLLGLKTGGWLKLKSASGRETAVTGDGATRPERDDPAAK
jgi:hypothetical protein